MSYAYSYDEAGRKRLRRAIRDERRLHDDIKELEAMKPKILTTMVRQHTAKQIAEARNAAAQVKRLLDLLNLLCSQVPALELLRGVHYGQMVYVCGLQEKLKVPEAERIHFELRGRPLEPSPYDEDQPQDQQP